MLLSTLSGGTGLQVNVEDLKSINDSLLYFYLSECNQKKKRYLQPVFSHNYLMQNIGLVCLLYFLICCCFKQKIILLQPYKQILFHFYNVYSQGKKKKETVTYKIIMLLFRFSVADKNHVL